MTLDLTPSHYTLERIVSLPMLRTYESRLKLVGKLNRLQERYLYQFLYGIMNLELEWT